MSNDDDEHPGEHRTEVMPLAGGRCHVATCSCGWESSNLPTHRRQALDDARAHRNAEADPAHSYPTLTPGEARTLAYLGARGFDGVHLDRSMAMSAVGLRRKGLATSSQRGRARTLYGITAIGKDVLERRRNAARV